MSYPDESARHTADHIKIAAKSAAWVIEDDSPVHFFLYGSENSGKVCKSLILGGASPRKSLNLLEAKKISGVYQYVLT